MCGSPITARAMHTANQSGQMTKLSKRKHPAGVEGMVVTHGGGVSGHTGVEGMVVTHGGGG